MMDCWRVRQQKCWSKTRYYFSFFSRCLLVVRRLSSFILTLVNIFFAPLYLQLRFLHKFHHQVSRVISSFLIVIIIIIMTGDLGSSQPLPSQSPSPLLQLSSWVYKTVNNLAVKLFYKLPINDIFSQFNQSHVHHFSLSLLSSQTVQLQFVPFPPERSTRTLGWKGFNGASQALKQACWPFLYSLILPRKKRDLLQKMSKMTFLYCTRVPWLGTNVVC